jgi:hypothetical protein
MQLVFTGQDAGGIKVGCPRPVGVPAVGFFDARFVHWIMAIAGARAVCRDVNSRSIKQSVMSNYAGHHALRDQAAL